MRLSITPTGYELVSHYCYRCGCHMLDKDFDMTHCDRCQAPAYHEAVARMKRRGIPLLLDQLANVCGMIGPGIHRNQKVEVGA